MKALTLMITLALLTSATAFADDSGDDISLYYGRMERNAQDWETMNEAADPAPKILFNQKIENPSRSESGNEGPGFIPVKHCVTGELVSVQKWQQDCGVPVHGDCRTIGISEKGAAIISCQ